MSAFLKIDTCRSCQRALPWEWAPAILLLGKPLPGTSVWRSQLSDGLCSACVAEIESRRRREAHALAAQKELIRLLGGPKPYREFTFERYRVAPGNRLAFERCRNFSPVLESLYLWGSCGVGKTHLAWAVARKCFEETLSVTILPAAQLSRRARMKDPAQEQEVIDEFVNAQALILDDLGAGPDTAFTRQLLQEILDRRDFDDRAGLVVTSKYSLSDLAAKLSEDTIPSRLAGMCRAIEVRGIDHRLAMDPVT